MGLIPAKYCCTLLIPLFLCCYCTAQLTVPWSSTLNMTFGKGSANPGRPLQAGKTGLQYTTDLCPSPGYYTITNNEACTSLNVMNHDAGHLFYSGFQFNKNADYMMEASINAATAPVTVFIDTEHNLCSNTDYLFWAGIYNASTATCMYPNFTFSVETTTGQPIQSYQTGDIGGANDRFAWYPGYWFANHPAPFPYYGGPFTLPQGVSSVVLKITANPAVAPPTCSYTFLIDNIILSPLGQGIEVVPTGNPDAWLENICYQGSTPLVLNAHADSGYLMLGTQQFKHLYYTNPAYQWQRSDDSGYTWMDIPGETNLTLSRFFPQTDTFFLRVRASEAVNINNQNCSEVSNIIIVQVNGRPDSFSVSSNSPVCTNGDLVFTLKGGASYILTGPNGFYDATASPHIYNPVKADSGWYHAQVISAGGCAIIDSVHVNVIGPVAQASPNQLVCYGKQVQLQASGGIAYTWSPATGLSGNNIANPVATPLTTTIYTVTVTDAGGCSDTSTVTVTLKDSILKAVISGPGTICPNDAVTFGDSSEGSIVSYNWDFGNGQASQVKYPPQQTYPDALNSVQYIVRLIVDDAQGCADTSIKIIKNVANCFIAVPSAFTPNGDGNNDYLYPLNVYNITHLTFRVYSRYGQVVFETKDGAKKWDGTFNGHPLPTGNFIWTLDYIDANNIKQSIKGTALLIR